MMCCGLEQPQALSMSHGMCFPPFLSKGGTPVLLGWVFSSLASFCVVAQPYVTQLQILLVLSTEL